MLRQMNWVWDVWAEVHLPQHSAILLQENKIPVDSSSFCGSVFPFDLSISEIEIHEPGLEITKNLRLSGGQVAQRYTCPNISILVQHFESVKFDGDKILDQ